MELDSGRLLLQLGFLHCGLLGILLQFLTDLFVLGLHLQEVLLPCVEVMLVLSAEVASEEFLDYLGLFDEELALIPLHFRLLLVHEDASTDVAPPHALDLESSPLLVVELPLDLEHAPILLDDDCGRVLPISILLGLVEHLVVGVDDVPVPLVSLPREKCHDFELFYYL